MEAPADPTAANPGGADPAKVEKVMDFIRRNFPGGLEEIRVYVSEGQVRVVLTPGRAPSADLLIVEKEKRLGIPHPI